MPAKPPATTAHATATTNNLIPDVKPPIHSQYHQPLQPATTTSSQLATTSQWLRNSQAKALQKAKKKRNSQNKHWEISKISKTKEFKVIKEIKISKTTSNLSTKKKAIAGLICLFTAGAGPWTSRVDRRPSATQQPQIAAQQEITSQR